MKFNKKNIDPYLMNPEKEKKLWEESVFVFDSSAILDFYFLPKNTRGKIYDEIFKALTARLWIPFHVEHEFLKNREKIIQKPISERYTPLRDKVKNISTSFISNVSKRLDEIAHATKLDDKHPHIAQTEIEELKSRSEQFKDELKKFEDSVLNRIGDVESEIKEVSNNDDLLKALEDYFEVGEKYSFERILDISRDGEFRYKHKIPPGYGDLAKKEKKGTQIFGDLIIWNQILDYSKEKGLPIIFITNDIKKDEDWCYLDKKATEERILRPREELIKEIKDHSGVEFWMYNLPQFLYHANKYLKSKIKEEIIQNISQFLNTKDSKNEYLKFECNACTKIHSYHKSQFDLEFECVGSTERNMGAENHYQAKEQLSCDCGYDIEASFNVWEYPLGVHNYDSVELEGAKLLESFYFTIDFFEEEYEPDYCKCHECSGNKDGMGNMVDLHLDLDLLNEYDTTHQHHKFKSVVTGNCDWCNTLHFRCAKCEAVNSVPDTNYDDEFECEGGCGLTYYLDTNHDFDQVGEFELKLLDHRMEKCSACGKGFLNTDGMDICEECENEYNNN